MSSPINGVTQALTAAQTNEPQPKAPAPPAKTPQLPTDTVTLSSVLQTPAQEAKETPAQTAQEAAKGDNQARRLLAREEAATQVNQK